MLKCRRALLQRLRKLDPRVGFFTGTIAVSIWTWIIDWWDPIDDLIQIGMDG